MSSALALFLIVPLTPVLVAPLLLLPGGRRWLFIAPWIPAAAFALLPLRGEVVELPWLLLGTRLGVDAISHPLVLLGATAWTLAGWHARRTIADEEQPRFFFFWLLTWCGNISVFLTLDAASFYAAYATLTVAAYGLVVHRRRPQDYRAGRVYLWMSMLGEGLLLVGLLILITDAGNLPLGPAPLIVATSSNSQLVAWLMMLGFGIKTGLAGLHMWLPLAHPQAPVPASAVLSGVIVKAGVAGWLRFLPLGQEGFETIGTTLVVLGFIASVAGGLIGVTQRGLKSLLAYSSISQMGLLSVITGLGLLNPNRGSLYLALTVLLVLHHGLNKAALFVSVDMLQISPRLVRRLLWLPAAALAAFPLTSGDLVKTVLKDVTADFPAMNLNLLVLLGSLVTTMLMTRFILMSISSSNKPVNRGGAIVPWLLMVMASLGLPWAYALAEWPELASRPFHLSHLVHAMLLFAAGSGLGIAVQLADRVRKLPEVPPGDLLHLLPRAPTIFLPAPLRIEKIDWVAPLARVERLLSRPGNALIGAALLLGLLILA